MGDEPNFDIDVRERPYAEALRIIADLHAAYGKGTELTMSRGKARTVVSLNDETHYFGITIHYLDNGLIQIDAQDGLYPDAHLPLTGVGAVRVWLHQFGGKR